MISILCPTRGRPEQVKRMVQSARQTAPNGKFEILFYLDSDDRAGWEAVTGQMWTANWGNVNFIQGPRLVLTKCWNELIPLATGDIFMQGNDDIIFKTKGWDKIVERAFAKVPDKILLAFGDDLGGYHEMKFGPHPFVHRRWVEAIGYFIPPYFSSDFGDTWVNELGVAVDCVKKLPVEIEHLHFIYGKAEQDATTLERLSRHKKDDPGKVYEAMVPLRELDVRKLKIAKGLSDEVWAGARAVAPKLDILILTQYTRATYLERLLAVLGPQVQAALGQVDIKVEMFEPSMSLGENRERLRRRATGDYICFIDDDDLVPHNYVQKILPLLTGLVDYVGFKVQCYLDGTALPPTRHSLRYNNWGNDADGAYRDISHLNPMRRELALQASMEGGFAEDSRWATAMRGLGVVKSEHYLNEVMYSYYSRSTKDDGPKYDLPPLVKRGNFEPQKVWRPTHAMCPACQSVCVILIPGGHRCNQCAHQFL